MQTVRETRPDRRYRRLIPAALTAALLSVSSTGVAHAAPPRPPRPAPAHVGPVHTQAAVVPGPRPTGQRAAGRVTGT
jgi:hypothetical protein